MRPSNSWWLPVVAVMAGLSCSPTSPSGVLMIVPDVTILKVGDQQTLSATILRAGTNRGVTAVWQSSSESVATVDSNGVLTARLAGSAMISASSTDGLSATRDIAVVSNVDGTWTGQSTVRSCGSSGVGFPCRGVNGLTDEIVLQLHQLRDQLTGTLNTLGYRNGPVIGTVRVDRTFVLTGTFAGEEDVTSSLNKWEGSLDSSGNIVDGRSSVRTDFISIFGPQFIWYDCDFHALRDSK